MNQLTIRLENEQDHRAVEQLIRASFWNIYKPGCDEHYFAHRLRRHPAFVPELDFVLEHNGVIIGNIMYSRAHLLGEDGRRKEILTFGPICIHPDFQRRGGSRMLIEHSCARALELGYDTVVILGNPDNYVGRGFVSCRKCNVSMGEGIYPAALLVKELFPGALEGGQWQFVDNDAAACCEDAAAVAAFDARFPPKEKAWQPSQEAFYIYSHSCIVQ